MSRAFEIIAERKILKAQAEGKLQGLKGEGKPLKSLRESSPLSAAEQVGYGIMAREGAVPEEVALSRRIATAREIFAAAKGTEREQIAMKHLADLQMRLAMLLEARRRGRG